MSQRMLDAARHARERHGRARSPRCRRCEPKRPPPRSSPDMQNKRNNKTRPQQRWWRLSLCGDDARKRRRNARTQETPFTADSVHEFHVERRDFSPTPAQRRRLHLHERTAGTGRAGKHLSCPSVNENELVTSPHHLQVVRGARARLQTAASVFPEAPAYVQKYPPSCSVRGRNSRHAFSKSGGS